VLIDADLSTLLVIDIQAKLNPVMFDPDRAPAGAAKLLSAAHIMDVPVLVSEQYPNGLGATVDALQGLVPEGSVLEKTTFSCLSDDGFRESFEQLEKSQAVLCGIEAHVCVLQTALELVARGCQVFVVADATASRTPENMDAALERIRAAGGHIVTVEMVLFEWLKHAARPEFKQISQLVK